MCNEIMFFITFNVVVFYSSYDVFKTCAFFSMYVPGGTVVATAIGVGLFGVDGAHRQDAGLVLVVVSTYGERVPRVPEDGPPFAQSLRPAEHGRPAAAKQFFADGSSVGFAVYGRCATVRAGGLQCAVLAGDGHEHA